MGDTRLPAISRLISRRSSHSYSIFPALRYHAVQCQAVWRKKTAADCWKCSLNSDKMLRGNSRLHFHVRLPYPERLWQKSSLETRRWLRRLPSREWKIVRRQSRCIFVVPAVVALVLHEPLEFHIPSKCRISLTNRNVRRKFRAAT